MKKEIKGFILGCVATSVIGGSIAIASNATNIEVYPDNVSIYANGQYVNSSNFTYNDKTYVPLRDVLELLNCRIDYDGETKTVKALNNCTTGIYPVYLNGDTTKGYRTIFDYGTDKFYVDLDVLIGADFSHVGSNYGFMFMDNDKYIGIPTHN